MYCATCDAVFPVKDGLSYKHEHRLVGKKARPSHITQYRCCDCDRDFKDEHGLTMHLQAAKAHRPKKNKDKSEENRPKEPKCSKCGKIFISHKALQQHASSLRHNPLSNIQCLAHSACKKRFVSPSGQLQHLESGHCISGMTRLELNEAIASRDTSGTITSGGVTSQWLLDDDSSTSSISPSQSPILTPTSTEFGDSYPPSGIHTPTSDLQSAAALLSTLSLQPRTRVGEQRCPLCPRQKTRTYVTSALNQHLLSGVHDNGQLSASFPTTVPEIKFHCPRGLMGAENKKVVKQFSTISGLAQHIESGACAGGKGTLTRVVAYVQEELRNLGFGERKLLG